MSFARATAFALALAALAPSAALASDRLVARDEPVASSFSARTSTMRRAPLEFDLVGLHWKGPGAVSFRTQAPGGVWSAWQEAAPETEDLPDRGSAEGAARRGWKLGSPYWTGSATRIQYRFDGRVRRLRAFFVRSDPGSGSTASGLHLLASPSRPGIIRRADWGADESIVRAPPAYAPAVHFAVVHHTAGTNSYSESESAAIVRGIERYHILANGWNDIGYNFLVDKYGQIFEGRAGGITRNVVGAHAQGFNTGSTGVAVLGTYDSQRISRKTRAALVKLLAWRLDLAHVDPSSRLTWISGGNPEYPAGTPVSLRAISGHRDTGPTSCPGGSLYAQLPGIATDVTARGLPKLYDPEVAGGVGGQVRFTARLSTSLPWTVTVVDSSGAKVATGTGSSSTVDWTWDASAVPYDSYRYSIAAGPDVRPATGPVPGPPPLRITRFKVRPHVVTPNGDGLAETASISYALSTRATVAVEVLDASAKVVRSLASAQSYRGGTRRFVWDARGAAGGLVHDGSYRVRLTATTSSQQKTASRSAVVDRTLGFLQVDPTEISPNADGKADSARVAFRLARQADVRVDIRSGDRRASLLQGLTTMASGQVSLVWDGRTRRGRPVADGRYTARVQATTAYGTRTLTLPVTLDTRAPVVKIAEARRKHGRTVLRLWLSEDATLRVRYGSPHWWSGGGARTVRRGAGYSHLRLPASASVRIRALDAALNLGDPVRARVG